MSSKTRSAVIGLLSTNMVVFFLASCIANEMSGSSKDWLQYSIELGTTTLELKIPPNESKDFPPFPASAFVSLDDGRFDERPYGIVTLEKWWDFRNYPLNQLEGVLAAKVRFRKVPNHLDVDVTNRQLFEAYEIQLFAGGSNKNASVGEPRIIHDRTWTRINLNNNNDTTVFASPIDSNYYVEIQFSFIDNTRDGRQKAKPEAMRLMDAILATAKIY